MDEQILLSKIARRFGIRLSDRKRGVRVGVGDDAAMVRIGRTNVVMTIDAMVEGIDFDLRVLSRRDVVYKAVSAAVSDLYACGATPSAFLITAGIPKGTSASQIRGLLDGIEQAAKFHQAPVVGGDLTQSPKLFLDVCAVGRLAGNFKTRRGARPGDFIFLSRDIGSSRAALLLFQKGRQVHPVLRRAHLRPMADRHAGLWLAKERSVTSMMDISDGLLIDLSRLCAAAGVSAGIFLNQLPIHPAARRAFQSLEKNPQNESAIGGEDYVLLFTVRPPVSESISRRYTCIGRVLKRGRGGPIYNMERRPPSGVKVKGFLHHF